MQERRNSRVLAMELHLSGINPLIYGYTVSALLSRIFHCRLNGMAAILQTTFSNTTFYCKVYFDSNLTEVGSEGPTDEKSRLAWAMDGWQTSAKLLVGDPVRWCIYASLDCNNMMMSPNGKIFSGTGPVCGDFTGHRWIPCTKASDAELWSFLSSAPE